MASKKVTIKGRGPEIFGRGIDLLFGEDQPAPADSELALPHPNGVTGWPASAGSTPASTTYAREAAYLDTESAAQPAPAPVDVYLRQAAEAFFTLQAMLTATDGTSSHATQIFLAPASEAGAAPAAAPAHEDHEDDTMPAVHPDTPLDAADVQQPAASPQDSQRRRVGVPTNNGATGADDSALTSDVIKDDSAALTRQEAKEITGKLRPSDLKTLDRDVDTLYEKVGTLLSGQRQEATVAFDILRRVRMILLKEPERYADAEYMVNQVRARTNQIEQSIEGGRVHAPRIFAYQTIWLALLATMALVTTVNGETFRSWAAYLLGIPIDSEQLNWAVLFLSTLAWGGIGGITSALWSLYHHISVARDYNPVENLWYYSQPMLGMVLGGIVFLIMGAGFLVVQVNLDTQDVALGARLLPASIAVIAGFRQNMVLDLIERLIGLIIPTQAQATQPAQPSLQQVYQQPPEEPLI
jgi:hypothetical protein